VKLEKQTVEALIRAFGDEIAGPDRRAKYANNCQIILKTFFRENGFRSENGKGLIVDRFKLTPRSRRRQEYIPTVEEALRISDAFGRGSRNRAIILVMIFTGLRNSTARALRVGDVKSELDQRVHNLCIQIDERMKALVAAACKGRISYYVFTHEVATEGIRQFLLERERMEGSIPDEAPLFPTNHNQISREYRKLKVISPESLARIVKRGARVAGIKEWVHVTPHSLRKTFESFLRNQPGSVRLDTKDQEFLMGHILPRSQDAYYDRTKIEEMRTKYSKLVLPAGANTGEKEQKIVTEDQLEKLLPEGWRIRMCLASGKVVIERDR